MTLDRNGNIHVQEATRKTKISTKRNGDNTENDQPGNKMKTFSTDETKNSQRYNQIGGHSWQRVVHARGLEWLGRGVQVRNLVEENG